MASCLRRTRRARAAALFSAVAAFLGSRHLRGRLGRLGRHAFGGPAVLVAVPAVAARAPGLGVDPFLALPPPKALAGLCFADVAVRAPALCNKLPGPCRGVDVELSLGFTRTCVVDHGCACVRPPVAPLIRRYGVAGTQLLVFGLGVIFVHAKYRPLTPYIGCCCANGARSR
mgnify:CR=1 FL=1